ncbi:MAG: PDZ domain-containing protein [Pseudomonadota bacterium]
MKKVQSALEKQSGDRLLERGVLILGFSPESAAQKAGMKKGDVIVEFGGIGDLTTESLASLTATTNPEETGTRAVFLRDDQDYSVELPPGPLGISAMDSTTQVPSEMRTAQDKIRRAVRRIQRVYLVFSVAAFLMVLSHLMEWKGIWDVLPGLSFGILYGLVYVGLRYRKEWVVTLILIFSAVSCLRFFILVMSPGENIRMMLAKVFGLALLLFFAYNIMFFRRARVRMLFGDKGTLVF